VIHSTFQLTPGVGPYRERQLWAAGVTRWDAFPSGPEVVLSSRLDGRLRAALEAAGEALREGDADRLAAMLPDRERWRLYAAFADEAVFLDVEADAAGALTAVSVLDRDGPRVFLRGRDLDRFPVATAGWKLLVTFNGLASDVPMLQSSFSGWEPPRAHIDLFRMWARLGHRCGLKSLERATGVGRPDHLAGWNGRHAVSLWERHCAGEPGALRQLAEYNLYDAVNLKPLMTLGYNRMLERYRLPAAPLAVRQQGDVLCGMTRQLLDI
jgi:hypothetical protein